MRPQHKISNIQKLSSEIKILTCLQEKTQVLLKKPPNRVNYRCLGQNRGSLDKIRPVIIQIQCLGVTFSKTMKVRNHESSLA
jgi:hypothetical protein